MKRKLFWKTVLVLIVLGWSLTELYPPTPKSLISEFQFRAEPGAKDKTFEAILENARVLEKDRPTQNYGNLRTAIGTNDITRYFPKINVKGEVDPTRAILNKIQRGAAGKIRLGLDLQGGQSFLVALDTSKLGEGVDVESARAQAIEVLRKRVDKFGVAEPIIQPAGKARILIQMPGLSEAERESARVQISKPAFLEFRMVHPQSQELLAQGLVEPGYEVLKEVRNRRDGQQAVVEFLVKKKAERGFTGKYIKRAFATRDPMSGTPQILFDLDSEGTRLFGEITREHTGKLMAIVIDGAVASAPVIREPIEGGHGSITGDYDIKSAIELANILENPMETPVKIEQEQHVDPSLGRDSIRSGVTSSIYGTIGVAAFMVLFYFFAGGVANFALMLNIIITMGVLCSIGSTLTLPGIAGIVLSIGMAVDANVLIFERIREELAVGKSIRGALAAGYDRAFGTIFDSHVTTLISAVVLIVMGTGPIKGFGVTLTIGVAASLFTALVVTRLIFDFLLAKGWMKTLPMMPIIRLTKIDFMAYIKPAFVFSAIVVIAGAAYGFGVRGKDIFGVDFKGGDALTVRFTQRVEVDKLRETVGRLNVGEPMIQYQRSLSDGKETLQILTAFGAGGKVEEALKKEFPQAAFQVVGLDKVGPTVGKEIQRSAIISILVATFGILFYVAIRYEFSFAVAAVLATAHDVLFTLGVFAFFGGEFSATMVAAVLTIIGYSINDKIVILDRIREDLKLGVRGHFRDLINLALNQTLSRTLITGGSVILATMSLFVFGGGVIHDFAFTFLVGILCGTYSSIFIACAVVLWWSKGQRPNIGSGVNLSVENPVAVRS